VDNSILQSIVRVSPFMILLVVVFFRIRQGKIVPASIGLQWPARWSHAAMWLVGFLTFAVGVELLLYASGLLETGGFKHHGASAAIQFIGMVVLAPIAEELLFRGIFLNRLERLFGRFSVAAVVQAILFVALHNFAYQGTVTANIGVAQSFADALLFAFARRHTGSILTPILMHASGNMIAVAEMLA
jgi:membrane protease YdiL (CAAX protease family)